MELGIVLVVPGPVVLDEAQVASGGVLVVRGVLLVPVHVRRGAVAILQLVGAVNQPLTENNGTGSLKVSN